MKWMIAVLLAVAPLVVAPAAASAASCPDDFHLHEIGDDSHEHGEHRHVGLSMDNVDRNGNGLICVKHATPTEKIHVHIDDLSR